MNNYRGILCLIIIVITFKPIKAQSLGFSEKLNFPYEEYTEIRTYTFNLKGQEKIDEYIIRVRSLYKKASISGRFEKEKLTTLEYEELKNKNRLIEGEPLFNNEMKLAKSANLVTKLSNSEIKELRQILNMNSKGKPVFPASCYYPRDAIIFYKGSRVIGYLEICFECKQVRFFPQISYEISEDSYNKMLGFINRLKNRS